MPDPLEKKIPGTSSLSLSENNCSCQLFTLSYWTFLRPRSFTTLFYLPASRERQLPPSTWMGMNGTTTISPLSQSYHAVNKKSVLELSGERWLVRNVQGYLLDFNSRQHYGNKSFNKIHHKVGSCPGLVYLHRRWTVLTHFGLSTPLMPLKIIRDLRDLLLIWAIFINIDYIQNYNG